MIRLILSFAVLFLSLKNTKCLAQQTKSPITVLQAISTPDFGYLPTYVARARGFFTDERLDLKVIVMNSRVSLPALVANEIHFGVAGPSIAAALRGAPLKAVFFIYNTSTFQFTVRPEIRGPEDLKGKTIAISSPGATNDLATRMMLTKLGLDPVRESNSLPSEMPKRESLLWILDRLRRRRIIRTSRLNSFEKGIGY